VTYPPEGERVSCRLKFGIDWENWMRKNRLLALSVLVVIVATLPPVFADEPGREFSATAVVNGSQGMRRMPVTFIANRFTSVEQAKQLAEVLEQGGQQALLSALTGRRDGQLRLGALEMPIALVVAEPQGKGYRYLFLTARRISVEETTFGEESLDYPFGIAEFVTDTFGRGEGSLHVAAALSIDADGHVEIEDYDGVDGSIEDLQKVR
jgi:hypothetical protein